MSRYLRDHYFSSDEQDARMAESAKRLKYYGDNWRDELRKDVQDVFKHPKVKELRLDFVDYSLYQNLTRRVIDEVSAVYSAPAMREVAAKDNNTRYQELQRAVRIDRQMRKANRFTNLLNEVFVLFRMRRRDRMPQLHVITPDKFYAVHSPVDPLDLVAIIYRTSFRGRQALPSDPKWVVWSDAETFQLDESFRIIDGTYREHSFGRIPGVLIHKEEPDTTLLNPTTGRDLISGHRAIALLNVLMIKEQKTGTKVPFVAGEIGNTAPGQPMESEVLSHFQEGVAPGVLDMGANPENYIKAARAVIKQVAANHGIPESVFDLSYQATSGFEIELKRVGLREKRRDQMVDLRPVERALAEVMEVVTRGERMPDFMFELKKWSVDFGEMEAPRDPSARLDYWQKMRSMGLISTIDIVRELNPEFRNDDEARDWLNRNIEEETKRVAGMRELQALNASPNTAVGAPSPQDNGARGREASQGAESDPEPQFKLVQ